MNSVAPSRQLLRAFSQRPPRHLNFFYHPQCQRRCLSSSSSRLRDEDRQLLDPSKLVQDKPVKEPEIDSGKLAPSIFDLPPQEDGEGVLSQSAGDQKPKKPIRHVKDWRQLKSSVRHPTPKARIRWMRKKIIQDVQGRHRLSRTEKLLRSERSHLTKSPFFETSIKKLGPLARQIAGKPIDEAILQMRFSKKKAAADVMKHLKYARDQAIVGRGMGLGKDVAPGVKRPEGKEQLGKGEAESITVVDKKGKRRIVTDRTAIYVDQAWIGRGQYGMGIDPRARGRSNRLMLPRTSISFILKEEATRIRLQEEREQKKREKKPWMQLPDRPVTVQRQYPLW